MKIAGMIVLAACTGWFVRGIRFDRSSEARPVPRVEQPAQRPEAIPEPAPVLHAIASPPSSLGQRNLFAYRIREAPAVVTRAIDAPSPAMQERPAPRPEMLPREPTPFPYRYIGTFGSAETRIAALKRDGDILTVRTGERLGEFVLRSIGLESIEVEGPDGVRRVALSSDL